MKENFFYLTINVRSQAKNMREVRGEERTDYWFYFNGFALWIGRNKQVEFNTLFKTSVLIWLNPCSTNHFPYHATFFPLLSSEVQGIVSFKDFLMFPTELLSQLSAAFGPSWFLHQKSSGNVWELWVLRSSSGYRHSAEGSTGWGLSLCGTLGSARPWNEVVSAEKALRSLIVNQVSFYHNFFVHLNLGYKPVLCLFLCELLKLL